MTTNKALGSIVHAGGGVFKPGNQSAVCRAWRKEASRWCKEEKTHKKNVEKWEKNGRKGPRPEMPSRSFNDRFYSELSSSAPSIREGILREVPLGIQWFGQVFSLQSIINSPTGMSVEAQALRDLHAERAASIVGDTPGAYDALRNELRIESERLFGSQGAGSAFYPDGMKDGVAIEIKGPNDTPGDGQYEKYQEAAPKKQILIIDNTSCDPKGSITKPNGKCK